MTKQLLVKQNINQHKTDFFRLSPGRFFKKVTKPKEVLEERQKGWDCYAFRSILPILKQGAGEDVAEVLSQIQNFQIRL